uniref:Ovule protein n=1 Tax=Panagrellus redivivus TaxID=6233 RepID=A0A7E4ULE2_PANRE
MSVYTHRESCIASCFVKEIESPLTSSVASVQRVLFTFCGVFVNRRFYKVFVVNESSSTMKPFSNEVSKTQSKGIQSPKAISTVAPLQR